MKARRSQHLQPPSPHVVHSPTVSTGHPYCFLLHLLWPSPFSSPFITLPRLLPRHPQALWGQLRAECVLNVNPQKLILSNKWGSGTSLPEIKHPCVVRRSEGGQDSTMRGKGHSTGAEWTVTWCPHEVGLTLACPTQVYTCSKGLLPAVGLGPEPAAGHQWFAKKFWHVSQILPIAAGLFPLSSPTLSSAVTQQVDSRGSLGTRLNPIG